MCASVAIVVIVCIGSLVYSSVWSSSTPASGHRNLNFAIFACSVSICTIATGTIMHRSCVAIRPVQDSLDVGAIHCLPCWHGMQYAVAKARITKRQTPDQLLDRPLEGRQPAESDAVYSIQKGGSLLFRCV